MIIFTIALLLGLYLGALTCAHFGWDFRMLVTPAQKLGNWIGSWFN
jgi:hypothetical protein